MATTRLISRIVPAKAGHINRLIGTVDIDGAGTVHDLAEVNPFILLDQGTIQQDGKPPFGAHPHRGHSVVTILMQGRMKSWDSFSTSKDDDDKQVLKGPAAYWVDAGTGVFHDETTVVDDESDDSQHVRLFQLWVGVREADRTKPPRVQYDEKLVEFDCKSPDDEKVIVGKGRYYVGGSSESSITTPHPIVVAHIRQDADTKYQFPIDPTHGGFLIHVDNHAAGNAKSPSATFGGTATPSNNNDVMILENDNDSTFIEIVTAKDAPAEYMVCVGEQNMGEPWAKKLVASGAVIAATPEEARDIASGVERYAAAGKQEGGSFAPFGV